MDPGLVTPACDVAEEYYLSVVLNRAHRTFLAMTGVQGGMDIEGAAATAPEALAKVSVDPRFGVTPRPPKSFGRCLPAQVAQAVADTLKL